MSEQPVSQLVPASVRAMLKRSESAGDLGQAFVRDIQALTFRRLRTAGVTYASVTMLSWLALGLMEPGGFAQGALIRRTLTVAFALAFAAASYVRPLEQRAFGLSVVLTMGMAAYLIEPVLRHGMLGSDHASMVLLIVCTGLFFPYTVRQMALVAGAILAAYLAAAIGRTSHQDAGLLAGAVLYLVMAGAVAVAGARLGFHLRESEFRARWELGRERDNADQLLRNILPDSIVHQLKRDQSSIAEGFLEATVLFADIVGFTPLCARMAPGKLVEMLNDVFSKFDALTERHRVEKIKTIGDAYMVVAGVPTPRKDHAAAIAQLALDMRELAERLVAPTGEPIRIRIGINSGPVVAGVIGTKRFSYDLWGDTVNTAARMEAHAEPGTIQVTERTYERIRNQFQCEPRGAVEIKGKGQMRTYVLIGPRRSLRPPPVA